MTLLSLAINAKFRPTYRKIGANIGGFIADATSADADQRTKIINFSTKAASIGLGVGCAILTADAVGAFHAAAVGATAENVAVVHNEVLATAHTEAVVNAHAEAVATAHTQVASAAAPTTWHQESPFDYPGPGDTAGALAAHGQQASIMDAATAPDASAPDLTTWSD